MKYDFTTIMDRAGKDSVAVDVIPFQGAEVKEGFSKIPMWVADMNYAAAPSVVKAVAKRLEHPAFGYFNPSEEYYASIIRWQRERNGVEGIEPEHIGYENGVLGAVAAAVQAFTAPGEAVLLHAPTYVGFTHTLEDNGRKIILSDLKQDDEGVWRMDYEDMDRKLKEYKIHFAVFCSPHNPCGRVWTREEIEKAMEIYKANSCVVVSDEIWSDLTLNGHKHIPTQTISEDARQRVIALYAPSKTFNLAGLIGSYHIIYNKYLRDRMCRQAELSHYNSMNVLSMHALIGAYEPEGAEWVDELREVLAANVNYAYDYITENFDGVELSKPEGTYMLYLDCSKWCEAKGKSLDELIRSGIERGVIWQDGRPFNKPNTIRMNLAVPHSLVIEAMERLKEYVF
ncbi:MalY/PatB family protein [Murimonas intestini]|uniref:cysteine-S-conjugate beta-lyase n=1 Tax=Murimonas intestini TaxID=1337051 RepID=A0AB73T955_9FIRM|nr:aminotransferase class I/II-fold pyridoxal phosphate-dependent enzyme [Murimonas intestini]MCR1840091.1 aminotransferase class I/II-fold pyridoxal phosphate-dependent enzyme [Murimonas intestini]MCR1866929.1 aminotransferase class I/II-fold pyridoxal phosphate-dependent enzyme [Murimonas intestini]MCR1883762.1 aminotransferase class I/II-fold pyridoxal phosphate-dependent enzyme [Murimonas intestini]